MSFKNGVYSFKEWVTAAFQKKPKVITPRRRPRKHSVVTLFRNKIRRRSKMTVNDIELLEGMDARELKKKFSVHGSKVKILERMVDDYNRGKLSVPGLSHKSKFNAKSLNKVKLNKMIRQYDETSRERIFDDAKHNAAIIKKKFKLSDNDEYKVEKLLVDVNEAKGSDVDLLRDLLEPKHLTRENLDKFIRQHEEARRKRNKNNKLSFKRWTKGVFKKRPKEITPTKHKKPSITTIFRNRIKRSKVNVNDIELIEGMDAKQLKKQFSVSGSRAKLLERMVDDYKRGRLSLPGLSHKSKFDAKSLDRVRLYRMIAQYDERSKAKNIEEAKQNAAILKKKFKMSGSDANRLEKVLIDLNKGKGAHVDLIKDVLDPKHLTKQRLEKFITKYEEAEKKNRGLSHLISQGNLSIIASMRKISNVLENMKDLNGVSGLLRKYH